MIILQEWIFSVGKDKRTELRIHVCLFCHCFQSICVLVESIHMSIVFCRSTRLVGLFVFGWVFLPNSDLLSHASLQSAVQRLNNHSEPCLQRNFAF